MKSATAGTLHISLLGEFHLLSDDQPEIGSVSERPQTLLTYLLLNRHAPQSRQQLAFLLWPDSSDGQARTNLRNLLYTLRQALPQAEHYLAIEPLTLQWRSNVSFTLDVAQFEQAIQEASNTKDVDQMRHWLETAVSLYRGDLLPGNYDDWIIPCREALRQQFLGALEKLTRLLEQIGEYRAAIYHAQRLLQQDALNEASYIQLMRLHALSNDRAGVRRIYQTCVATLAEELGVEPAAATQTAYEQLLRLEATLPAEIIDPPTSHVVSPASYRPLPVPPTPFIGRESELAEIAERLANPDCRLLTIVGLGGMGKTRLALQTAVGHQPVFRDGVAFVPLAPLQTADLLVTVIGDVLQVNFFASGDPRTQLFHFLSQKETLLVLDNFEHLLDGAETVSALLTAAPHIKVLITSRQRLDLQEEWVYEIGGLPLPEINEAVPLTENSAIILFRQSAQRADSRFTLTTEDKEHVVRICRLVGGMPLAIELAASWVRLLSCAEIAGEIERGLDFLAVSLRNIPERHRSIQTVFNHTWHLLTPLEQQTLARLSVFRGGFTREAAQQVTQATLPLLSALVDKSLVRRIETNRYDLHELIRQYAYEQLAKSNEFEDAGNRHFAYFLALAEENKVKLRSSELVLGLNVLERDYNNLRSALEWSLRDRLEDGGETPFETYRGEKALRLTTALYLFWKIRVYWGNGRKWLHRALDLAAEAPPTFERIEAMKSAALLAVEQMDLSDAKQLAERALVLARKLGDAQYIALILNTLGIVLWKQKEYEAARSHGEEALSMFRNLNMKIRLADVLQLLGRIAINQNNLEAAQPFLEECLAIFEEVDDKLGFNAALSDLGLLAYLRHDYAAARQHHHQSLGLFREARSLAGIEMTLNRLGDIVRCEGNYDEAGRYYQECWAIFRDTGDKDEIPSLLHNLGYVALHRGEHVEAMNLFRQGMSIHNETGNQAGVAECLAGIAAVMTAQNQAETAACLFGAAETLRQRSNAVLWPANRLEYERSLAALHEALDDETLSTAWSSGRSLSTEQIDRLLSPPEFRKDTAAMPARQ